MTPPLDLDELVERFTLLPDELALLRNKTGATRLGFAMLLKHLIWKGQFPRGPSDLPDEAVEFVARQVKVPAADIAFYDWDGRQIKAHRRELRETLGWRPCSVADAEKLTDWLAEHVCTGERRANQVRLELLTRCRREQIEPPATPRIDAIVGSALHLGEQVLFSRVFMRPEPAVVDSILALVGSGTDEDDYPLLAPALARPIRWDLIARQYDQMVKYATAIRTGTATTEAILRRFTRNASHPTYAAMLEVGRAEKTAFLARYLRIREMQREVNDGLNVMESWNGANDIIHVGKRGDIASNRRDEQELEILCLHILQAAMVYINTLMIQDVLGETGWAGSLTDEDRRGLTPLFWTHVLPYGEVHLDLGKRLTLGEAALPAEPQPPEGGSTPA